MPPSLPVAIQNSVLWQLNGWYATHGDCCCVGRRSKRRVVGEEWVGEGARVSGVKPEILARNFYGHNQHSHQHNQKTYRTPHHHYSQLTTLATGNTAQHTDHTY